ncbi:L,D-transpeptidase Cds6 family protein [Propionivibrio dicarboxylicus]|uniref:SnoaL-like domain-containing protein n=1 Tax=Propionivibrio dicarboxylicus TaxID=83767 RepID=A0A1G7XPC4_9RHOO|nr:tetratricopeptide repeat protein [Propionivibrio dicarboxylicus]SDG85510.1 SnoaL-like domain-containing protein [Propionivibrio dicarboxylicus]
MFLFSETPSLARLTAVLAGLVLCFSASCINAQQNTQAAPANTQAVAEIQRLMKQGQLSQALEKTEQLIASKPRDAQGRFLKGLILTESGRQQDAIAIFTRLTEDFPELPEPYNNLAVLYAQQKQYDKARTALEMAIRTHPSYAIAHENLGDVYAKLASQAYDKALQLDSSNKSTQSKLSMIKDLITTKPGAKPTTPTEAAVPTPTKVATAEPAKPAPVVTPPAAPAASKPTEKPAEKPAEAAADAKKAEPKPSPEPKLEKAPVASGVEADITKALQSWASAWSNKDVKGYLSHYAGDFQTPNGMPRKAWESERAQRIDKPGKIQVSVDNFKISIAGDKATVKFRQHYTSATLKTSAAKTIVLVKSGSRWLIQQERVG